jgi:hypothetical protein
MLKKDKSAGFIINHKTVITYNAGTFHETTDPKPLHAFKSGKLTWQGISERIYMSIIEKQKKTPVIVAKHQSRTWWMFENEFYWTDVDVKPDDAKALILAPEIRKKQKIEREIEKAKATIAQVARLKSDSRQPIPDDIKMFVWQRDNGRCVKCGSNKSLEFDHIIPFSQGGSNTARNLQILCETCNRSKGGNLF